ncbi:ATP-dependent Clp protease proteolytic subunit [Phaeobacter piscinae]|uniref:ATP-dependent Clp protease proteolytic subunit n=1 Tax=Phaeobacter piscinae TaxID=1580596 RepID=UPI000C9A8DD7|nr:ATP-dependent Clp protease proteolytic subunit [Phaeobacter piscinae]AUQ75478.1 Clp protease [Phaeobacter piscinae]
MGSRCWFILHLRACQRLALWGLACVLAASLMPHAAQARQTLPPKFKIDGTTLIYDTDNLVAQEIDGTQHAETGEISDDDIEPFRDILDANPAITRLQLNSGGGSVYAGESIADIVQDHALDTWVVGECISACVDIFLAGNRRQMTLGSKIGFHQRDWAPKAVQSYYRLWRKDENWATPFEFGTWIYRDTQSEVFRHLKYMMQRGVDPAFAIETLKTNPEDVWYPTRLRLMAAGVLRETP